MRVMFLSMLAVTGIAIYGFSPQKSSDEVVKNAEQVIGNINGEEPDPIVTGISISKEHLKNWAERNRKNASCNGCFDPIQPYPGDEI